MPLLLLGVMQWIGTLASPALFDRSPLLLAFLSPRAPFLLYASASSPFVVFLLIASVRMLIADPLNYCIGRRFGPAVTQRWASRGGCAEKVVGLSERIIDRCGVVAVACRPNAMMLALAGSRRLNPWATGAAAVIGTVTYAAALALTADAAADPMGALVGWARTTASPLWQDLSSASAAVLFLVVAATAGATLAWFAIRGRLRLRPARA